MNNFTKEELEIIKIWGNLYKFGASISWPAVSSKKFHSELEKKIQKYD